MKTRRSIQVRPALKEGSIQVVSREHTSGLLVEKFCKAFNPRFVASHGTGGSGGWGTPWYIYQGVRQ